MRTLKKYKFSKVYDLQNSNRTSFYKRILFNNSNKDIWSSSLTTLPNGKNKEEFDKLDTNNSGYITIGEYLNNFFIKNNDMEYNELRNKLNKKITIFENVDINDDKKISLEEVIEYQYKIMNIIYL